MIGLENWLQSLFFHMHVITVTIKTKEMQKFTCDGQTNNYVWLCMFYSIYHKLYTQIFSTFPAHLTLV